MRSAVLGNSGSGKSTFTRMLASQSGAALLDLDTVMWEPGQIAVARSSDAAKADVQAFCAGHESWVVEGCYASLVDEALRYSPTLFFEPWRGPVPRKLSRSAVGGAQVLVKDRAR